MLKDKYEWMGQRTHKAINVSTWMSWKSRGGAFMPSKELLATVDECEKVFSAIHGNRLSLQRDPIGRVTTAIKAALPHLESDIAEAYSKARFFLRLNELNRTAGVLEKQIKRKNAHHKSKFL